MTVAGAVAGIVVGAVVFVILIIALLIFCCLCRSVFCKLLLQLT